MYTQSEVLINDQRHLMNLHMNIRSHSILHVYSHSSGSQVCAHLPFDACTNTQQYKLRMRTSGTSHNRNSVLAAGIPLPAVIWCEPLCEQLRASVFILMSTSQLKGKVDFPKRVHTAASRLGMHVHLPELKPDLLEPRFASSNNHRRHHG